MTLFISGIGTALPRHTIEQADAATIAGEVSWLTSDQQRLLSVLYRRAGVKRRHSVVLENSEGPLESRQSFFPRATSAADSGPSTAARMARYEAAAGALAIEAARAALADAGVSPAEISNLITVSCSGFSAPGFDIALFTGLALRPDTSRTHVGFMGCHGSLNALRLARAMAHADRDAYTLICCVELCSLHHQYEWDPDQIVANALFADGAAALICRGRAPREGDDWRVAASGSTLIANSAECMQWRIGDHGFEMCLSTRVPDLIHRHLRPWLEGWLKRNDLAIADIGAWAIHPGGPRILSACGEAVGLRSELLADSQQVLAEFGNMSSPTVLFILDRLRNRQAPRPAVMLGFGPGIAVEAALLR